MFPPAAEPADKELTPQGLTVLKAKLLLRLVQTVRGLREDQGAVLL